MTPTQSLRQRQAEYDASCKRMLSHKAFLARLMKYCIRDYADVPIPEIEQNCIENVEVASVGVHPDETNREAPSPRIAGMPNEETSLTEGKVYYDIRFRASVPRGDGYYQIIVNVEAQNRFRPGYPLIKRALYYCGRMISAQNGVEFSGGNYQDIRKVYSIWVCTHPVKEWKNNIARYTIREEKLVGVAREDPENYDLMTVVMVCLGDEEETERLETDYKSLLKMLEVLLTQRRTAAEKKQILQERFDIPFGEGMEEEAERMCNLSEGVYEEGIREGKLEGIREGKLEGIREGKLEGIREGKLEGIREGQQEGEKNTMIRNIQSLMKNAQWSVEQAMDILGVPVAERFEYAKEIAAKNPLA